MVEPKNELQRNAFVEARRKELETYQRALDVQWLNSRMDDSHIGQHLARIRMEAKMEKDFQERTDHVAIVNELTQKEIALGSEIAKQTQEVACQELRRHYLREHDPALRELIKKLQAGYVCRDLKQQILDNEYRRLQKTAEERQSDKTLSGSFLNDLEAQEKEERERIEKKTQYCQEVQQQLVNKQRVKQCQYEEMLIEKKMLEDIMRTLADEDQRELRHKREQTEKMRREMETFQKAREAWKLKHRQLLMLEEKKIEEQAKVSENRNEAIVAARERRQQEKERLNERVVSKILTEKANILEREETIRMLREQEHLESCIQQDLEEKRREEETRNRMGEALENQLAEAERREQEKKKADKRYLEQMMAKLESLKKKDMEKEIQAKEKKKQYAMELKKQIEENTKRRQKEREIDDNRAKRVFEYGNAWDAEVSEERKKIISKHASPLLGYLQPGVLLPNDVPVIREAAKDLPSELLPTGDYTPPNRFPKCNAQCRVLRRY